MPVGSRCSLVNIRARQKGASGGDRLVRTHRPRPGCRCPSATFGGGIRSQQWRRLIGMPEHPPLSWCGCMRRHFAFPLIAPMPKSTTPKRRPRPPKISAVEKTALRTKRKLHEATAGPTARDQSWEVNYIRTPARTGGNWIGFWPHPLLICRSVVPNEEQT